jgi:homoserine O-acetyltransferase
VIVTKQVFKIPHFKLESGAILREVELGYECYGKLNADASNAILICHYFSGHSHAAGRYAEADAEPGYWNSVIGPGKAIDTDKYFVFSMDVISNVNTGLPHVVTTGPASINPETGRPYAAGFPIVTVGDFVNTQKLLCDHLGIRKLHAVAGPSLGSLQAMEWSARYPEKVDRVISAIPANLGTDAYLIAVLNTWAAPIRIDPNFNEGEYYGQQAPLQGLSEAFKLVTLNALHHGWAKRLFQRRWTDPNMDPLQRLDHLYSIETTLNEMARLRASQSDANSFLRICRAVQLFSVRERKEKIRAKFLVIDAASDVLMFPAYADDGASELKALGLSVERFTIKGDGGHLDGLSEIHQAAKQIAGFLEA